MRIHSSHEAGVGVASFLALLGMAVLGGYLASALLPVIGVEAFKQSARWISGATALLLAPVWVLYSDLKKIRDRDDLTNSEGREVRHRVRKRLGWLLTCAGFMIFAGLYWFTTGIWPQNETVFRALTIVAGALLFTEIWLSINAIYNIYEANQFESLLAARKLRQANAKKQLEQLKAQ